MPRSTLVRWPAGALVAASMALGGSLQAATNDKGAAVGGIYTCVDANGNRLTSDRPIPQCSNREQRVLGADGSVRRVVPPSMTTDERLEYEARQQRLANERKTQQDITRRDRNLLARFPTEAAHNAARSSALDVAQQAIHVSQRRLDDLTRERKPLLDEAEFYVNKTLPAMLKQQLESNAAAADAQRVLIQNQQAEMARINANYDLELSRLRRLWTGAAPGSLGPLEMIPAPEPAASAPGVRPAASAVAPKP